jgi:hypothetical protein
VDLIFLLKRYSVAMPNNVPDHKNMFCSKLKDA